MTSYLVTFATGIAGGAVLAVYWAKIQTWLSGETVRVEDKIKDKP